jgi:hypothetical protein
MYLWILRIFLYVQLLLGLTLFFVQPGPGVAGIHELVGLIIFVAALIVLRPRAGVPYDGIRMAARFAPILPLALGLAIQSLNLPVNSAVVGVHMLLGIATLGLVEMAAARERRALKGLAVGG